MRGVAGTAVCGSNSGYSRHMKTDRTPCRPCRKARDQYNKRLNYRRHLNGGRVAVDATGTRRRLQALSAIGWRYEDMAALIGVGKDVVRDYARSSWVQPATAVKVTAVYEKLSGTPGPSAITRRRAEAKGWVPPLGWDEGEIDDPAAVSYTEVEAAHAAALAEDRSRKKVAASAAAVERIKADPARYAEYLERRRAYNRAEKQRSRERQRAAA